MNPTCKDIAQFLAGESSLGLTLATNLTYGRMPDNPDNFVTVFDNPGHPPMLTLQKSTSAYFYSSINIRVRNIEYAAAYQLASEILTFLHGLSQRDSQDGEAYYAVIKAIDEPQVLYWDKNDRVVFLTNFDVQRKPINI